MTAALSLPHLDAAVLTPVVQAALDCPTAIITTWEPPVPLSSPAVFNPSSGGVYRLRGTAATTDGAASLPWSAVLKVLRSPAGVVTPDGTIIPREAAEDGSLFLYWKREVLAYQEGLLADLPPGLSAPRCLGIVDQPEEHVWLWL